MLEEKRLKSPPTCTNTKRGQNVFRAPMFRVALSNDIV
jgi:hypothetical protein